MPDRALLTERGLELLGMLPVAFRNSPEHVAIMHCAGKESELAEQRIDLVRRQFFATRADVLLKVWESMLRITVEPVGLTEEERQAIVLVRIAASRPDPSGLRWRALVTGLVGPGWTYEEHIPDEDLRSNLVTNPRAEGGTAGVNFISSAGLTTVSIRSVACRWHAGTASCFEVTATQPNDSTQRALRIIASPGTGRSGTPVTAGESYTFSLWATTVDPTAGTGAGRQYTLMITWFDALNATISSVTSAGFDDEGVTDLRAWVTGEAPAGAVHATAELRMTTNTPNDVLKFQSTNLLFEQTHRLGDYFDGSTEGYDWVGAADASASVRVSEAGIYRVQVTLPFPPESDLFGRLELLLREIVPAHIDLELISVDGFLLDVSQLDEESVR